MMKSYSGAMDAWEVPLAWSEDEITLLKHDVALQVDREIARAVAVDVAAHDGGRARQRKAQLAGMVGERSVANEGEGLVAHRLRIGIDRGIVTEG